MTTIENNNPNKTRPDLLKILCILTFVGGGMSLFSNITMFFTIDIVREAYENGLFDFLAKDMDTGVMDILLNTKPFYFIIQAFVLSLSVYGAYLMWNLKKVGFHFYTIAQIILLIIPQIFLPGLPFPTFELIVSLIFVILYAKNLQVMI